MSGGNWAGPLHAALADREVVVVCGTAGVGKTTVSAALAVAAARGGRRVLVMTIDPARRLASSLGIDGAFNEAAAIDLSALPGQQVPLPEGAALHAMMLDAKSTWDGVVHRFAGSDEIRDRILGNHYYQRAAGSLAGSQEYMAMEKLLEVVRSERYDLVVLDTPPTRNALDFLEAPERMMAILQDSIIKWIAPASGRFSASRAGALLFGRGQQAMFSMFERFVGEDVLQGISEFISSFSGLLDGMRSRAAEVMALFRGQRAAFVLVASPSRIALAEALFFHDRLDSGGIDVAAIVVNRSLSTEPGAGDDLPETAWEAGFTPSDGKGRDALVDSLWDSYLARAAQRHIDDRSIAELHRHCGKELPLVRIPQLDGEVHDLDALAQVAELLTRS